MIAGGGGSEVKGAGYGGSQGNEKEGRHGRRAVMAQPCANCSQSEWMGGRPKWMRS